MFLKEGILRFQIGAKCFFNSTQIVTKRLLLDILFKFVNHKKCDGETYENSLLPCDLIVWFMY